MTEKYFIDSNVWLYLLLNDDTEKSPIAQRFIDERILNESIVISWQVINEVTSNLLKRKFPENQIAVIIEWLCKISYVENFTEEMLVQASDFRRQYMLSFWDSLIISAATTANCQYLVSEDMQHGQMIEKHLQIVNPFV
jgi:predicted nucleic acid-binding protein